MGTGPHSTNQRASLAPLTRADRLQIALALHTPVECDVQAANYREKSDEELLQLANALFPAIENRTIFLDGEILSKAGFADAVREQYAVAYRGIVAAHQLVGQVSESENQETASHRLTDGMPMPLEEANDYHLFRPGQTVLWLHRGYGYAQKKQVMVHHHQLKEGKITIETYNRQGRKRIISVDPSFITKNNQCRDCQEESDELVEDLCPECLANYAFCSVCQEWIEREEARTNHRHLYLYDAASGIWLGSGGIHTPSYHAELKAALFAILDRIGSIAEPLMATIRAGEMGYTTMHFEGPQPGRTQLWCYLDGKQYGRDFNRLDEETEGSEEADLLGLGVRWLLSLDGEDTHEANELTGAWIAAWQAVATSRFTHDFLEHLRGDYYEEPLAARKGWLGMLLSIAENLTHSPSTSGSDLFDALAEAILDYRRRYPRMAAAMQHYLQSWLRANAEH